MIGRLRGEIVYKQAPQLLLDVHGVGYELEAPMSTFYDLPPVGAQTVLYTHLQVREDAQTLYAFATESERELFRSLLKVSGVGAKMALAILSGMDVEAFTRCVHDGDAEALTRLPGIGKKTAERLIVEMRDRVGTPVVGEAQARPGGTAPSGDPVSDAVQALIALGYKPQEASRMVRMVDPEALDSEEIIRRALRASLK